MLRPGALVLIDPGRQAVAAEARRCEAERPIYTADVRCGYRRCWCLREKNRLLRPANAVSPWASEIERFPNEAEIIGQAVGVSMRLIPEQHADRR
jgi:hypothetical protein